MSSVKPAVNPLKAKPLKPPNHLKQVPSNSRATDKSTGKQQETSLSAAENVLGGEGAKASPYSRYHIAIGTPVPWKHELTVSAGSVPTGPGRLEDGTPQSISADSPPPPCVHDTPSLFTFFFVDDLACFHTGVARHRSFKSTPSQRTR